MEAEIIKQTKDLLIISWGKPGVGFGELTMEWDSKKQIYELDSELMDVTTILEIFKALNNT